MIVSFSLQFLRKKILRDIGVFKIMGIQIPFAITQLFHETGRSVTDVKRYGKRTGPADGFFDSAITGVKGIAFGSSCQIDGGLGQGQFTFGKPDKLKGLHRGNGDSQCSRVSITDILGGKPDHAPGDIKGIFTGG